MCLPTTATDITGSALTPTDSAATAHNPTDAADAASTARSTLAPQSRPAHGR